jgi:hypothetical protein
MKLTKEQKLELEREESGEVDTENNLVRGSGLEIDLDTYDPDAPLGMPTEEEE